MGMAHSSKHIYKSPKGINSSIVEQISQQKNEPGWMTEFLLRALVIFEQKPMPSWGPDLSELDAHDIHYYVRPLEKQHSSWDELPADIKATFTKLGIPQAE